MFVLYSPTKQNIFNYWGYKGKNMIKTMKISVNDDVKYVLNGENILFMQIIHRLEYSIHNIFNNKFT